jgi:hypothetical protein
MKKIFVLAIAIAAVLALVGCKGKKETSGQVANTETVETEQAADSGTESAVRVTTSAADIDLTALIKQEAIFLGMFGDKHQKMGIAFLSMKKINDTQYAVTGKSKLENNIDGFSGTMEVEFVEERRDPVTLTALYGLKDGFEEVIGKAGGKYRLEEDRNQPSTGVFEGTFEMLYLRTDGDPRPSFFTDINASNIQVRIGFTGTWKSHRSGSTYSAIWGNDGDIFEPIGENTADGFYFEHNRDPEGEPKKARSSGWAYEMDSRQMEDSTQHPDYAEWHEWWK